MEPIAEGAAATVAIACANHRVVELEEKCRVLAVEVDRLNGEVDKWQRYAKDLEHDMEENEQYCAEHHYSG